MTARRSHLQRENKKWKKPEAAAAAEKAAWAEFRRANPQLPYVRAGKKATWKKLHWVPAPAAAAAAAAGEGA